MTLEDLLNRPDIPEDAKEEIKRSIAERKQAEDDIQNSNDNSALILENLNEGIWQIDKNSVTTFANPAMANMLGYTIEEMIGKSLFDFMDDQGKNVAAEQVKRRQEGIKEQHDFEFMNKSGARVYVSIQTSPITDKEGNYLGAIAGIQDITEKRQNDEKICFQSNLLKNMSDAIIATDPQYNITFWNNAAEEQYGWTAAEVIGHPLENFIINDYLGSSLDVIIQKISQDGQWKGEVTQNRRDGVHIPILSTLSMMKDDLGRPVGFIAVNRDITERKRLELVIKEKEETYFSLFENSADIILIGDPETGIIIDANKTAESMLGYSREELIGMNRRNLHPSEYAGQFKNHVKTGRINDAESRVVRKDGTNFPVSISASMIQIGGKDLFQGVFRDISQRELLIATLKASEKRYRSLFETSRDAIMIIEPPAWRFTDGNPATIAMFLAKDQEEFSSHHPGELSPVYQPDGKTSQEKAKEMIDIAMKDGSHYFEWTHKRTNGEEFPANVLLTRVEHDSEYYLQATVRDLSEQRLWEAKMKEVQKMESLGQLAGGVAHDFNNMLSIISGNAGVILESNDITDIVECAKDIIDATKRSKTLTTQLLAFARKGKYEIKTFNLCDMVNKTISTLDRTIDKKIELKRSYETSIVNVSGDQTQLENALFNIAINARDAMPDGGSMQFTLHKSVISDAIAHRIDLTPGEYATLTISDTGTGMSDEVKRHIFEPFFTTKEPGKGTGLGLASVYGTMKSHNGAITVKSEPGKGTSFTLYLPIAQPQGTQSSAEEKTYHGTGNVLVIDDEEKLCRLYEKMIGKLGYSTQTFKSGPEGIAYFIANSSLVDIVLLDMNMPGMSGYEVYERIMEIDKTMSVILITGYAPEGNVQKMIEKGVPFVQKPFEVPVLSEIIKKYIR